jgi:hypothetical protein
MLFFCASMQKEFHAFDVFLSVLSLAGHADLSRRSSAKTEASD